MNYLAAGVWMFGFFQLVRLSQGSTPTRSELAVTYMAICFIASLHLWTPT